MTNTNTNLPEFTVTARGEQIAFTSAFATLADAYRALDTVERDRSPQHRVGDFAQDLLKAARDRKLSPKQAAWIHKLATDAVTPKSKREPINLSGLRDMLVTASEAGAKFPKLKFDVAEQRVVIKLAGPNSQHAGCAFITDGRPYGDNTYFGKITTDGFWQPARAATPELITALVEFAANPSEVAGSHGRRIGSCIFCSRELLTKESLFAGYGPVCADKFGLAWGEVGDDDAGQCEEHGIDLVNGTCRGCSIDAANER